MITKETKDKFWAIFSPAVGLVTIEDHHREQMLRIVNLVRKEGGIPEEQLIQVEEYIRAMK